MHFAGRNVMWKTVDYGIILEGNDEKAYSGTLTRREIMRANAS